MKRLLISLCVIIYGFSSLMAQDIIDSGDITLIKEFRVDNEKRFSFGQVYKKNDFEDLTKFVKRILDDKSIIHHGVFELNEFRNCIVSFATYKFQKTSIIIGLLLEPTSSKDKYKLLKIMEMSSGCGEQPEVVSVFLHNADPNAIGRELIIHASDYCGKHGEYNYVFVYNGLISNNKLELSNYLSEHCDYSEEKIDGKWDYDMGNENAEEKRYNKCKYSNLKSIRTYFNNLVKE
ncbi:hypothetical protein [Aquimarina sp. 2201CG5-10]|uniref:hypothetical protein n=1 Tax=Aquimarina callyspongiae TaxID=3098150 RepID=UPI002AB3EC82|nr:hypothetical protein [Aquimarina sp. 2201CG5-10]MDY8137495.1 hypothetical protein [Aquimarina sp. 2201CG5-10]